MLNITKKFGDYKANDKINFRVKKGEIHALMGENGAGKSTLMNILFGFYSLDSGEIKIDGKVENISSPYIASDLKIGMVHQHFKLVDIFSVAENITLGHEYKKGINLDKEQMNKSVQETIDKYKFNLNAEDIVGDLSVGQQQQVEILKMLHQDAEYLIFDEPSGALTPLEIKELLKTLKELKKHGKTIILITHKIYEIREVCDSCTIIRKGKSIKTVTTKDVKDEELVEFMVGRRVETNIKKKKAKIGDVILDVKNLTVIEDNIKKVNDVSFSVHSGEILGIAAVEGNGQIELIESIMGFLPISSGDILKNNQKINNYSIRKRNDFSIGYIPQDRQKYGLVLDYTVSENSILKEYYKKEFSKFGILNFNNINNYANKLIKKNDIRTGNGAESIVKGLSGGNQQKLIIGREIENNPDLLIAVQPTRGVDVGAIENIQKQLLEQRDNGKAIILVSLELDEVLAISDRVAVMHKGEILGILDIKDAKEETIGLMMAGKRR